jgi:serine/threonine protein kinase
VEQSKDKRRLSALHSTDVFFQADPARNRSGSSAFLSSRSLPDLGAKYLVTEVIGQGGMGVVLKAEHLALGQTRAVKLLRYDASTFKPTLLTRFRQEAMITSDLSHPNIIRVYDFDHTPEGVPFIVMEYLEGKTLEALLAERSRLPFEEVIHLVAGVADALDQAHGRGVIHRDIKPANLFLTNECCLKILDFGISQIAEMKCRVTAPDEVVGTLLYMAPEQLQQKSSDGRSDLYAFASVVYEMLAGRPVIVAESYEALVTRLLDDLPLVSPDGLKGLPPHAAKAIERALQKDPEKRFKTAWEFVIALIGPSLSSSILSLRLSTPPPMRLNPPEPFNSDTVDAGVIRPVPLDTVHPRRKKRRFLWRVLLLAILMLTGLLFLNHLVFTPEDTVHQIAVVPAGDLRFPDEKDPWRRGALAALTARYLNLDPRVSVFLVESAGRPNAPSSVASNGRDGDVMTVAVDGREGAYILKLDLERPSNHEILWEYAVQAPDIESAVESATWAFSDGFVVDRARPGDSNHEKCADPRRCRLAEMTEKALLQGLFKRADRLAMPLKSDPDTAFTWLAYAVLRCGVKGAFDAPVGAPEIPSFKTKAGSDRAHVIDLLGPPKTPAGGSTSKWCDLMDSDDALVRAMAQLAQKDHAYCGTTRRPICKRLSSFFDRADCLRASEEGDSPKTTREYFVEFAGTDLAHFGVVGTYSSLFWEGQWDLASRWLGRMRWRFGTLEPGIAESMVRYYMAKRDGTQALIWARRSKRAAWREGLALQADGWLDAGLSKVVSEAVARIGSDSQPLSDEAARQIKTSLQPVILTKSADLARTWLEVVGDPPSPLLSSAVALVSAVRDRDRRICARKRRPSDHPFDVERLYWCDAFDELVRLVQNAGARGYAERAERFFLADALFETGALDRAAIAFAELERDPVVRAEFPVAAVFALERLGAIAERRDERDAAVRYYRAFSSIWPGLDVPIGESIRARKRLNRLERALP